MTQSRDAPETVELNPLRSLDVLGPGGKPSFVSAASGLVQAGELLHVVADDSLHLASFRVGSTDPGTLFRLIEGSLPAEHVVRKRLKPDFEVLTPLPPSPEHPFGSLLALGSGSRLNRRRGALVTLGQGGEPIATRVLDASPLFAAFKDRFAETNIEGAVRLGDELLLFQRGNAGSSINAIVTFDADRALAALMGKSLPPVPAIREVDLGQVEGTPLSFTDATLAGDRIVFAAAAERTTNAYDDGVVFGAVIGVIDGVGRVDRFALVRPRTKIEGIEAQIASGRLELTLVNDADDPLRPAQMFAASLVLS